MNRGESTQVNERLDAYVRLGATTPSKEKGTLMGFFFFSSRHKYSNLGPELMTRHVSSVQNSRMEP